MELNPKRKTYVVAHRGASYKAPENTIPSFQLAFDEGADFIEGDFRLTKDNEIVCVHDPDTSRITANKTGMDVGKSTLSDLKKNDVGSWKSDLYKGAAIPTLEEIFEVLPDGKGIYIEIKDFREIFVKILAEKIEKRSVSPDRIRIITFDSETIRFAKKYLPSVKAYRLFSWFSSNRRWVNGIGRLKIINNIKDLKCEGINVNAAPYADLKLAEYLKNRDLDLCAYDVSTVEEAVRLINLGAHSITTDSPLSLRKGIESLDIDL